MGHSPHLPFGSLGKHPKAVRLVRTDHYAMTHEVQTCSIPYLLSMLELPGELETAPVDMRYHPYTLTFYSDPHLVAIIFVVTYIPLQRVRMEYKVYMDSHKFPAPPPCTFLHWLMPNANVSPLLDVGRPNIFPMRPLCSFPFM